MSVQLWDHAILYHHTFHWDPESSSLAASIE